ncbi:MAG: hypothetical protein ACTSWP_05465 [Candidatus Freyarchaeota archaeon]|nr:hypothetical protein [Candidatus Freyrarchaeum guaymaensis]
MDVLEMVEKAVDKLPSEEEEELRRLNINRRAFASMIREMLEAAKSKEDRQRKLSEILSKYSN